MSIPTIEFEPAPDPTPAAHLFVPGVVELLDSVVSSAEPAVVFLSVAQVFVPAICSSAVTAISEAGERAYAIVNPRQQRRSSGHDDPDAVVAFGGIRLARNSVMTEISGRATSNHCAYEGVLVMTFPKPDPTHELLGQLVVDRAVGLIALERQHDLAEMHRAHADNLSAALRSSRDIGIALGIIMSRYQLTEASAFDLLRTNSQDTQRKIRDIALNIAVAGDFDVPGRALASCGATVVPRLR